MAALVAALRQAGVEIWAVSSTNRWVVAEGVRDFGIPEDRVLAAEVRVVDGLITSEIVDVPTDEGKAAALKRVGLPLPTRSSATPFTTWPCSRWRAIAFPVNPSPALLEAAAKNGWGYFRPGAAEGVEAAVAGRIERYLFERACSRRRLQPGFAPRQDRRRPVRYCISFGAFTLEAWKKPSQIPALGPPVPPSALWRPR